LIHSRRKNYAVKTIPKEKIQKDMNLFLRELEVFKNMDHPNIVRFYETYHDEKYFHLVMESCGGISLVDRFFQKRFEEKEAANIMHNLLCAIYYMHSNYTCHRDLKPDNLLFSLKGSDSDIKVIDFGFATTYEKDDMILYTQLGTGLYMAPEIFKGKYDYRCDN